MDMIPGPLRAILNAAGGAWRFPEPATPEPEPETPEAQEDEPPTLILPAVAADDQPTIALFYCKRCKVALTATPLCSACRNELAERYGVEF